MKIKILFFGITAEITGTESMNETLSKDTEMLDQYMQKKYPELKKITYRIAVNREIINKNTILNEGDEVAFLPPFAGG